MSGRDDSVAHTGVTTESDDMFALDCMESLHLKKPCDTTEAIVPGDIIQAPRLVRGVATGSEDSVRIVQAAKSGWVVAQLGLPGAKIRRASRATIAQTSGLVPDGTVLTQRRKLRNAMLFGIYRRFRNSLRTRRLFYF